MAHARARYGASVDSIRYQLTQLIADPTPFLGNDDAYLRRLAIASLDAAQAQRLAPVLSDLTRDEEPSVRAAAIEKLGSAADSGLAAIEAARSDPEPTVREAAATAYGEIGDAAAIGWLASIAEEDPDRAVREAAVASLGAIGDPSAVDALLALVADGPPQVRRRAVASITVFDDPRIEPALQRAALDRNPGVREAAEMVVGRQIRENT